MMSELGQAALDYAASGLHVFPCAPGEKGPAGWLVRNGQQDATTDAEVIRGWWKREPKANIGVYLKRSGLVAVDPDLYKPNCEWDSFTAGKSIPETLVQKSPRGGRHYIYRAPADAEYAGKLCEGVDIKWDGYILLAPSVVGGKAYEFETQVAPSEAPVWIPRKVRQAAAPGPAIKQGDRSATFFATVRDYCRAGLSPDQIEAACRADPETTGAIKYLEGADRLRQEIDRSLKKPDQYAAMVEHGRGLWEGCTHVGGIPRGLKKRAFRLRLAGDFEASEPVWLIEGIVEVGTLTLLFGDPGIGKSFLAIDWGYCVATGIPFLGRPVRQGTVVYIAGEGHRGFGRRREAWGQHHGVDTKAAPFYMSEGPANILDAVAEVKAALADLPAPPDLVIFDTLARNFGGGDENSTKDMTAFIAAVDDLKADWPDCSMLIVHHSGHTDKQRARGAMALKGAVDTEYRLEAAPKGLLLTNTKMKDGDPPKPLSLAMQTIGQSTVLVEGEDQPTDDGAKVSPQQRMALDAYVQAAISLGHPGDDTPVPTEAWRQAFYEAHGGSNKRWAFNDNRKRLADKGFVTEDGDGYRPDHHRQMAIRSARKVQNAGAAICV